jgi:hypothetical protein
MKEQYIQMRNKQELDNRFLWSYYKEQGGKLQNPNEFLQLFYQVLDKKFNLTTLWNKNGNFIKVIV